MKYEKLWRYLFNQFFCGNLDRLGGNMSDLMEEALSHNITHLTRDHKSIFWPKIYRNPAKKATEFEILPLQLKATSLTYTNKE